MEDPHFAQATALLEGCTEELLRLVARTDGWSDLGAKDGVTGGRMANNEGPQQVRTQCTINKPVEQVRAFLWDFNNKSRWDEVLKEIRMVKPLGDNIRIMYEQSNAPWPVSNRDFVYAQRFIERPDGFMIMNKSIDAGVPEVKGVVRAEIHHTAIYLKRIGDGSSTELTIVGCVDPKGSIPTAVVNKSAKKQIGKLVALKKLLN